MKTNYKPDAEKNCRKCKFGKWLYETGSLTCLHESPEIPPSGRRAGFGIGESVPHDFEQMKKFDAWADARRVEDRGYCDDFIANIGIDKTNSTGK